jgi:hypothetical protein
MMVWDKRLMVPLRVFATSVSAMAAEKRLLQSVLGGVFLELILSWKG